MLYRFEDFELDASRRELRQRGSVIAVQPQVFDLLAFLIANRDRVVSKDDLIEGVWRGRIISESAITTRINAVRSAIKDDGNQQRLIRTITRKGFRFLGTVRESREPDLEPPPSSPANEPGPALPDRPSIAVLPFLNMSGDPGQEHLCDGVVDDIITALCRFKSLFVIARNSSFTYKGKTIDIRQIGRELGVRYVLEGSLRKGAGRLRITGQLIDATDGSHLWADKFDGPIDDIFDLQDKITKNVVAAIAPNLERAEIARSARKPPESFDALDCYYRATASIRLRTPDGSDETLKFAQRAIELDPNSAAAHALAAHCYMQRKIAGWKFDDNQASEGKRYAIRAVELGADDAYALAYAAQYYGFVLKEFDTADALISQALAVNPNLFVACLLRGWISSWMGEHEAAVEQFHHAIRLSPIDPQMFLAEGGMAITLFLLHRFDDALAWNTRALARYPNYLPGLRYSPAMYAMQGRMAQARNMFDRLRQLGCYLSIAELREYLSYKRPEDIALIVEGYRLAGDAIGANPVLERPPK
jgi:TolB-like protein/Tfp pilus assembly protein PilF